MLQGRKSDRVRKLIEERGWKAVKYYVWNLVQQHKKRGQNMTNAKEQKNSLCLGPNFEILVKQANFFFLLSSYVFSHQQVVKLMQY